MVDLARKLAKGTKVGAKAAGSAVVGGYATNALYDKTHEQFWAVMNFVGQVLQYVRR
jgi:hypothetical protein